MNDEYVGEHEGDPAEEEEPVIGDAPPQLNTLLSNRAYDVLKFVAMVFLPALGALYFGIAEIWGLPHAQDVVGTIVVLDLFFGAVLGVSGKQYQAKTEGRLIGVINVKKDDDGVLRAADLEFPGDPQEIVNHDKVTFKVKHR